MRARAALGIDAAWTAVQPSGVALVVEEAGGWQLQAVAPSYGHFIALAHTGSVPETRPEGDLPNASSLLHAGMKIAGRAIDLVAIDMPLSLRPIIGRRVADNAVSRAYGARKCGTHTPSIARPGRISDDLRSDFESQGFALCTTTVTTPGLIEAYPHPALVELAGSSERLPYKAGKTGSYWKGLGPSERRERLLKEWERIIALLDSNIANVSTALPPLGAPHSGVSLKGYEDMIDAVVCAWVAIEALHGRALPFGDSEAAIWIPGAVSVASAVASV